MAVAKRKSFDVTGRIIALAGITIFADSYEEAVAQTKTMKVTDFITFENDHIDSSLSIGCISKTDYFNTDQD